MHQHLEHEHDNKPNKRHPDKQDEIVNILRKKAEVMANDIGILIKLAEYYYGTDKVRDYGKYIQDSIPEEHEDVKNPEHLYTLIKYEWKNVAVQIGTGEFTSEVFTRRDITEYKWFSHSPLPLFVVAARAAEEYKDSNPKKFFNQQAILYSPKWWQVEERIGHKQRERDLNYGESNGIINYVDALLALQNAQIHKTFPNKTFPAEKSFDKLLTKIKELKIYTQEDLQTRSNLKEAFFWNDTVEKIFYTTVRDCLRNLSGENRERLYTLIQSFDLHKQVFTHTHMF